MDYNLVFRYPSSRNECGLAWRNDFVQQWSKLCNKDLGDYLIYNIAEAYGVKVIG